MTLARHAFLALFFFPLALAHTAFGQITAATISGAIKDQTGAALPAVDIQEFRVVTNAYAADCGRAMGGIINLVTKSGTNTIRGSGFEFFRDSALDARDFFDRGAEPPPFRRISSAPASVVRSGKTVCSSSAAPSGCRRTSGSR